MTFTEAAAEVLRLVGKPLHYKEITELAIEKNLLSHVGKSPEVTMGARLAALIKKEDSTQSLVRLKPGVFGLREWDKKKGSKAQAALENANEALDEGTDGENDVNALEVEAVTTRAPVKSRTSARRPADDDDEIIVSGADALRENLAASGAELFDDEDDDDEPILAPQSETAPDGATELAADGSRRRRRRRRRGRGRREDEPTGDRGEGVQVEGATAEPSESGEAVAAVSAREGASSRPVVRERHQLGGREAGGREERAPREDRGDRGPREDRGDRGPREDRGSRSFDRDQNRDQERAGAVPPSNFDGHVTEGDELAGRELADLALSMLANFDRNAGPASLRTIAEALMRKGRLASDAQIALLQLCATLRADNLRRQGTGQRPRFRFASGMRVTPTDWILGADVIRLEQEALLAVERVRDASRRALLRRLQELPGHAFVELALVALEKAGLTQLRSVKRSGTGGGEMHFSAIHRTGGDEIRTAIVLRKDGRELGRERVSDLRGSLHHYQQAKAGWLITTGQVLSGAREEASVAEAAPIALYDGLSFCRLLEEQGVGVIKTQVSIMMPDLELLETLRGL